MTDVRIPTSPIGGITASTTLPMTGSEPKRNLRRNQRQEWCGGSLLRFHAGLGQHHSGLLEILFEGLKEFRSGRAVDDAMIAAHRDVHDAANDDLAVANDWRRLGTADSK